MKNFLFLVLILIASCADNGKTSAQQDQLNKLTAKLTLAEQEISQLREQVSELRKKMYIAQFDASSKKITQLTPGQSGYSRLEFDLGVLTVSLDDIKPYATGSKVTLSFGNTLSSTISGLNGTIEWGALGSDGTPTTETIKSKQVKFSENISAGAWTKVNVVLEGVPPTEFGYLLLRDFAHSGILLKKN